ncbi:deoxyribodipyrimidine photo-lyase [soil metagenome]
MQTVIHWFRRDFRITDNTALAAASEAVEVVPVYIVSSWSKQHQWTGANRQGFLCGCLNSLSQNLEAIGSRLIIRQGDALEELEKLVSETRAEAIYFNRDPDPYGREVEGQLAKKATAWGVKIVSCQDVCIHERDELLTGSGGPYRVFTPYAKAWAKLPKPAPLGRLRKLSTPSGISSLPLPTLETWGLQREAEILPAGEKHAQARLRKFLETKLARYGNLRDTMSVAGTSRLSQDLRHGLLSIRKVFAACSERLKELGAAERSSAEKYIGELIWREFYQGILWHYPEVLEEEFNPKFRGMKWPGKEEHLSHWQQGETGFPIVDAAMRELNQTGFMHNRCRMITAMFLTKDLHLDWRLGESYFMQKLVDGEIASNNGGWQWSAGTGADAAPYFRIQNPWSQAARFDPDGEYIKRWVPELRDVSPEKLARQPAPGERLAKGYPAPMVDHAVARQKTLELYKGTAGTGS